MYLHMHKHGVTLLLGLLTLGDCSPTARDDVRKANAEVAYTSFRQWYNQSTGLWIPSTGWWNSANCLTVITDLAAADRNIRSEVQRTLANTYAKAQQYNLQMTKVSGTQSQAFLPRTFYTSHAPFPPQSLMQSQGQPQARIAGGFLNDFYDDEGWWALAWIAAYDLTRNARYLSQAQTIFADMHKVFGKANCSANGGGTVASGMINSNYTVNDGLSQKTCKNNQGTVWSYNQGVILGALTELSRATGNRAYITRAQKIADAGIAQLAPTGVLTDPCEPNCGQDGAQFKGVFARNLRILHKASPRSRYAKFLDTNANSIWRNDRNHKNELSVRWTGPFVAPANASTQSSALDALVASLST